MNSGPLAHTSRLSPLVAPAAWAALARPYDFALFAGRRCTLGIAASAWSSRVSACFACEIDGRIHLWGVSFPQDAVGEILSPLAAVVRLDRVVFDPWLAGPVVRALAGGVVDWAGEELFPPLTFEEVSVKPSVQEQKFCLDAFRGRLLCRRVLHAGQPWFTQEVLACRVYDAGVGRRTEFDWDRPAAAWEAGAAMVLAVGGMA